MGNISIKKQSAASVTDVATDELKLFVDTADSKLKTKDDGGNVEPAGVGTADDLKTATGVVDVAASAAPAIGDVLVATSPTVASWQNPTTHLTNTASQVGPITYNAAVGDFVLVDVGADNVTVTLPAGHTAGDEIGVKLTTVAVVTTNQCVVDPNAAQTIDDAATATLDTDYEWIIVRSDGTNWLQVG